MVYLRIAKPGWPPKRWDLTQPVTLGRDDTCSIVIKDPSLSRAHCRLERAPEGWVLVDLCSTNGTLVNGELVARRVLRHGDEVALGDVTIDFNAPPVEDARDALQLASQLPAEPDRRLPAPQTPWTSRPAEPASATDMLQRAIAALLSGQAGNNGTSSHVGSGPGSPVVVVLPMLGPSPIPATPQASPLAQLADARAAMQRAQSALASADRQQATAESAARWSALDPVTGPSPATSDAPAAVHETSSASAAPAPSPEKLPQGAALPQPPVRPQATVNREALAVARDHLLAKISEPSLELPGKPTAYSESVASSRSITLSSAAAGPAASGSATTAHATISEAAGATMAPASPAPVIQTSEARERSTINATATFQLGNAPPLTAPQPLKIDLRSDRRVIFAARRKPPEGGDSAEGGGPEGEGAVYAISDEDFIRPRPKARAEPPPSESSKADPPTPARKPRNVPAGPPPPLHAPGTPHWGEKAQAAPAGTEGWWKQPAQEADQIKVETDDTDALLARKMAQAKSSLIDDVKAVFDRFTAWVSHRSKVQLIAMVAISAIVIGAVILPQVTKLTARSYLYTGPTGRAK